MAKKTPAVSGRGLELLTGVSNAPTITATLRIQYLASRYALPLETAAIVASLYFMEAR